MPYTRAANATDHARHDYIGPYVSELDQVIDMDAIKGVHLKIGVDPLGGAGVGFWQADSGEVRIEPRSRQPERGIRPFAFMTLDHDCKIRMDCSSPLRDGEPDRPQRPLRHRLRQ